MQGFRKYETNIGIGEMAGKKEWFLTLHANSFEQAEMLKAIDASIRALRAEYRKASEEDDAETKRECVSAEVTLKNLAKCIRGGSAQF